MPMTWNSEADARLLAAMVQICKPSGDQMKEIVEAMGSDCTIKALYHRFAHLRKVAGSPTTTTKTNTAPKKPNKVTKPKAAAKRAGTGKKAKAEAEPTPPPSDDDDNEPPTPPPTTARGKKRARIDNDDGLNDDVKIEVGEDIGEGLRAGAPDEDEF